MIIFYIEELKKNYETVFYDKYNEKIIAFNKSVEGRKFYEQGVSNNGTIYRVNNENRKSFT